MGERLDFSAKYIRSAVHGAMTLSPRLSVSFTHIFRREDGAVFSWRTKKPLHLETGAEVRVRGTADGAGIYHSTALARCTVQRRSGNAAV